MTGMLSAAAHLAQIAAASAQDVHSRPAAAGTGRAVFDDFFDQGDPDCELISDTMAVLGYDCSTSLQFFLRDLQVLGAGAFLQKLPEQASGVCTLPQPGCSRGPVGNKPAQ